MIAQVELAFHLGTLSLNHHLSLYNLLLSTFFNKSLKKEQNVYIYINDSKQKRIKND